MTQVEEFFKNNISTKIPFLQDEHKKILEVVYRDAVDQRCIHNFKYDENKTQSMKYTDINEKVSDSMDDKVLHTCLLDLVSLGFLVITMRNTYKETEYAVSYLGLKYFEYNISNN